MAAKSCVTLFVLCSLFFLLFLLFFVLFCFILFCFVLCCFVSFCFVLFCFGLVVCLFVCLFVCLCVCLFGWLIGWWVGCRLLRLVVGGAAFWCFDKIVGSTCACYSHVLGITDGKEPSKLKRRMRSNANPLHFGLC